MKKLSFLLAGLIFSTGIAQISESAVGVPVLGTNLSPNEVIIQQTDFGTSGIVSDSQADGSYTASADDFDLTYAATKLTKLTAFGFCNADNLAQTATGVSFYIIADDDWIPVGTGDPKNESLFAFEMDINDPALTFTGNQGTYTFELDLSGENVVLPAGKYWLSVVANTTIPDIAGGGTERWNWYQSLTDNGIGGHLADPNDLFGVQGAWYALSDLGLEWTHYDLAMIIEGEESTMGLNDLTANSISVYPNPTTNFVKATGDVKEMIVVNMNGQVVASSKAASVNVSTLPSGVYIVKVVDAKGNVTTSKVVKK